jgi:predicted amidophosphoribosyltransferase
MVRAKVFPDLPILMNVDGYKECFFSRYYISQNYNSDSVSKSILEFKNGNKDNLEYWLELIDLHFNFLKNKVKIDIIIRILGSNELNSLDTNQPIDVLGRRMAIILNAKYDQSYLKKTRQSKPLKTLKSTKERQNELLNLFTISNPEKLNSKNVLIIDDIKTSGSSLTEISKSISKVTSNVTLYGYCLAQSTRAEDNVKFDSLLEFEKNKFNLISKELCFGDTEQAEIYRQNFYSTLNDEWKKKLNISQTYNQNEVLNALKTSSISLNQSHFKSSYLPLVYFPELKHLDACFCLTQFNVSHLKYLDKLTSLRFHGKTIVHIEMLPPSIQILKLYELPNLRDFNFLTFLSNIEFLQLSSVNILNLSFLNKTNKIKKLHISYPTNQLNDISILSKIKSLEELKLNNISINHLSDIISPNLISLKLDDVSFVKTVNINYNWSIKKVKLSGKNTIGDLSFLTFFLGLEELEIDDVFLGSIYNLEPNPNYIDFRFLINHPNLKKITLDKRYSKKVDYLSSYFELRIVNILMNNLIESAGDM